MGTEPEPINIPVKALWAPSSTQALHAVGSEALCNVKALPPIGGTNEPIAPRISALGMPELGGIWGRVAGNQQHGSWEKDQERPRCTGGYFWTESRPEHWPVQCWAPLGLCRMCSWTQLAMQSGTRDVNLISTNSAAHQSPQSLELITLSSSPSVIEETCLLKGLTDMVLV